MRKIALFIAMLLLPCVSFAGLLSSNSPTTPVSKEYKQQLMATLKAQLAKNWQSEAESATFNSVANVR